MNSYWSWKRVPELAKVLVTNEDFVTFDYTNFKVMKSKNEFMVVYRNWSDVEAYFGDTLIGEWDE